MDKLRAHFIIVEEKNCPLYEVGERLQLSEKTLSCPQSKEVCLILVRDMTELMFRFLQKQPVNLGDYGETKFNCSGCKGLIKFTLLGSDRQSVFAVKDDAGAMMQSKMSLLSGPVIDGIFFRSLPSEKINVIVDNFQEITIEEGSYLIRKDETNLNLYMVFSGKLVVEEGGQETTISAGEICGEMSYLGADIAVSSVRAIEDTKVLAIAGDVFGRLLGDYSSVQRFMAQLFAARLRKTSATRARDLESCMRGRIDEIVPAELFQIFHMHQKTGVLLLELPAATGKVSFREGCIINARYGELLNEAAIFAILAEKRGNYLFTTGLSPQDMRSAEIGDFMSLLMEGIKRIDEEKEH